MAEEQVTYNRENIGPVEAYHILWKHNREENRLLSERTTIFLAASSILFLAFVMLNQSSVTLAPILIKWLCIILPVLGILLTLLFYSMARGTLNRLEFLWYEQENIERVTPEFTYMRERGNAPQIDSTELRNMKREWKQNNDKIWVSFITEEDCLGKISRCLSEHAYEKWLPLTFGVLWVASLVVAIVSLFNSNWL